MVRFLRIRIIAPKAKKRVISQVLFKQIQVLTIWWELPGVVHQTFSDVFIWISYLLQNYLFVAETTSLFFRGISAIYLKLIKCYIACLVILP